MMQRVAQNPRSVWTPGDFVDLAVRDAVDKTLQRLARSGELRRIERGLYDKPSFNSLTDSETVPDYRAVIEAVARRDKARFVIDGMTAANELGLTTAVPAKIEVLVDARLKTISFGNQKIVFKYAAPSRLFWAGRPAMSIVQALHWMQDVMNNKEERAKVKRAIEALLASGDKGNALAVDLREGLSALPIWMQEFLRKPLELSRQDIDP
ncbi:MAG: hypothetical protein JKY41_15485 [Rhodobacteraceae bacterium]|nr:hypothetical protein [Paracoccaceae bacterium]